MQVYIRLSVGMASMLGECMVWQKHSHCNLGGCYNCDECQILHDHTTYWALPMHTTFSDHDYISRSQQYIIIIIIIIYSLTARVVGAPWMISQPVSSIFSLFSTALWDLANSWPKNHVLMLSSHLFLCLPCLLPPFIVPCKMVLARPDERETCPYPCSLHRCMLVRRSLCGLIACWILAQSSSVVTWSFYEMRSVLR